jgi:hypothetical protein
MENSPSILLVLVYLIVFIILPIAGMWKMFQKAGQPGWAAIVPIYNVYILHKVADRPGWWLLLYFIPLVNIVIYIIVLNDISENFGKGGGFTIGLFLLSFIFFPILGFGDATYKGRLEDSFHGDILDDNSLYQ